MMSSNMLNLRYSTFSFKYLYISLIFGVSFVNQCKPANAEQGGGLRSGKLLKWYSRIKLPPEHIALYFNNHPQVAEQCRMDEACPYAMHLNRSVCWGYEANCPIQHMYRVPRCPGDDNGWVKTKQEQIDLFFKQGDFGYIKERKKELKILCKGKEMEDSQLECTSNTRFCRGRNILIDFKNLLTIQEPMRYREDVIGKGQIGGHCNLDKNGLRQEGQQKSPLQSWYAELEHFTRFEKRPIPSGQCEFVIKKPTFIMKLDATVSMYHHFCDFVNLYASLHLNNSFSKDVYIIIWDTIPYRSNFGVTWEAFTDNPILDLTRFRGKKVCFEDVVFPLLPRMIFGMYYNMPLVPGCEGSGFFHAFNRHILYHLNIRQEKPTDLGKIRITLISRGTRYRRINNEDELVKALKIIPDFVVRKVNFSWHMPFKEQLKISHNTDILIGMHGSGLTHMLFLPDWAAVFEIYNCEDENCYKDLARLRGVKYFTWENIEKLTSEDEGHHPTLGAHAKFTNYSFDVEEFMRIVQKAAEYVRNHKAFKDARINMNGWQHNFIHDDL